MVVELLHAVAQAAHIVQQLRHFALDHARLVAHAGVAHQRLHDLNGKRQ